MSRWSVASVLVLAALGLGGCGDAAVEKAPAAAPDPDPIGVCETCVAYSVAITNKWPKPIVKLHFENDRQKEWIRSPIDGDLASGETERITFYGWEGVCNFYIRAQFADGTKQIIMHDDCGFDTATFEPAT